MKKLHLLFVVLSCVTISQSVAQTELISKPTSIEDHRPHQEILLPFSLWNSNLLVSTISDTIELDLTTVHKKQVFFEQAQLEDIDSIQWDLNTQQVGIIALEGDRVLKPALNQVAGGHYTLIIKQDVMGARALDFSSSYKFPDGHLPALSPIPGSVDIMSCVSDGINLYCNLINNYQ